MKKDKVFPNVMFEAIKEIRRIGKDLGVEVKIKVMDGREYLRSCGVEVA